MVFIASTMLLLCPYPLASQTIVVTKESPVEAKLALIDTGSAAVQTSLVRRYATLLDTLAGRCDEDRTMVSDMAVRSTEMIKEQSGRQVKVRTILEETVAATVGQRSVKCSSIMAAVAVMIKDR